MRRFLLSLVVLAALTASAKAQYGYYGGYAAYPAYVVPVYPAPYASMWGPGGGFTVAPGYGSMWGPSGGFQVYSPYAARAYYQNTYGYGAMTPSLLQGSQVQPTYHHHR
jgi:hypothetical protein